MNVISLSRVVYFKRGVQPKCGIQYEKLVESKIAFLLQESSYFEPQLILFNTIFTHRFSGSSCYYTVLRYVKSLIGVSKNFIDILLIY